MSLLTGVCLVYMTQLSPFGIWTEFLPETVRQRYCWGGLSRDEMCIGAFAEGGVSGSVLESGDGGTDQVVRSDPRNLLCLPARLDSALTSAGKDGRERGCTTEQPRTCCLCSSVPPDNFLPEARMTHV